MKANGNLSKSIAVVASILFLAITIAAFFWLWRQSLPKDADAIAQQAAAKYQTVNIDTEAQSAADLIKDKGNAAGMPIAAPTADTVGRDNPFNSL